MRSASASRLCRLALPWALGGALLGCGHAASYDYRGEPDPRGKEFVVGPADVLRVHVWRDEELTTDVPVRPDGTITIPLVGDLKAAGHTPSQIRQEIGQRLARYFKDSVVTVTVQTVNSYRFTVSGNVNQPGVYSAPTYVTVIEALSLAGGPNRFAATDKAVLIRRDTKGMRRIPISVDAISDGRDMGQNVVVLAGDVLVLP